MGAQAAREDLAGKSDGGVMEGSGQPRPTNGRRLDATRTASTGIPQCRHSLRTARIADSKQEIKEGSAEIPMLLTRYTVGRWYSIAMQLKSRVASSSLHCRFRSHDRDDASRLLPLPSTREMQSCLLLTTTEQSQRTARFDPSPLLRGYRARVASRARRGME